MKFHDFSPTSEKGKYCLYSYFHGSFTSLGYKDCLQVTVTESVTGYKTHVLHHFSCGQWICILCASMTPSPRPSTLNFQPLNLVTSHYNNNNNNNNGGLHACVRATEDIEPIRVTRTKYSAPLSPHWGEKDHGQPCKPQHLYDSCVEIKTSGVHWMNAECLSAL